MTPIRFLAALVAVALLAGAQPAFAAVTTRGFGFAQPLETLSPADNAAGAYCRSTGGKVELRHPEYGTNNPTPLVLAGSAGFCQYTKGKGSASSRIYVRLSTLYATKPTLAALAYYARVKLQGCSGGANPASCYCSQLGGTDLFGGINAAGGAWVLKGAIDEDLDACIFPDFSSIDSWGLAYHSAGIIRGINLRKVLRYQPTK